MARMIPAFPEDRTPPGEVLVFSALANSTNDWIVFHSLDLAPSNRGRRTEIDFVVIIPRSGIICIEVKSQERITFEDGRWHPSSIKRSPFKQATDGASTLYRRIAELAPECRAIPVCHCCVFPFAAFRTGTSLSINSWELIDGTQFRRLVRLNKFCTTLENALLSSIEKDPDIRPLQGQIKKVQLERLEKLCIPVATFRPDLRLELAKQEEKLASILIEQQRPVLELAAHNPRIIVSGPAGTGKTLVAIEVAIRAALKGHRTGLFTFNRLIGDWIHNQIALRKHGLPQLVVGSAHKQIMRLLDIRPPQFPSKSYWQSELPELIEERLTDPEMNELSAFDYLVLDEAQDFLSHPYLWSCVGNLLVGGIAEGKFALFGDFDSQNLFRHEDGKTVLDQLKSLSNPVNWPMSENCRNYRIIGETAVSLSGFSDSTYSAFRRSGGGHKNYEIHFYDSDLDQEKQIKSWISEIRKDGFRDSEITLLSFCSAEGSIGAKLAEAGYEISPAGSKDKGIQYASIHAYKGMENKVILITDVMIENNDIQRDLFYTGMTRATERVGILSGRCSKQRLLSWQN